MRNFSIIIIIHELFFILDSEMYIISLFIKKIRNLVTNLENFIKDAEFQNSENILQSILL